MLAVVRFLQLSFIPVVYGYGNFAILIQSETFL